MWYYCVIKYVVLFSFHRMIVCIFSKISRLVVSFHCWPSYTTQIQHNRWREHKSPGLVSIVGPGVLQSIKAKKSIHFFMKQTTYKVVLCLQYLSSCDYLHLLTKFWPLEQFSLRWEESSLINTYYIVCLIHTQTETMFYRDLWVVTISS